MSACALGTEEVFTCPEMRSTWLVVTFICAVCPARAVAAYHMGLSRIPPAARRMAPPESMEAAAAFVEQLVGLMFQGQCVAMHCRWVRLLSLEGANTAVLPNQHDLADWMCSAPGCTAAAEVKQSLLLALFCRGGVGRAGLMAACVLLRLGISDNAEQAIAMVSDRMGTCSVGAFSALL